MKVEGRDIKNPLEIAQAMNDYCWIVSKNLHDKIMPQPNPLRSNEYTMVENATRFEFVAVDAVAAEKTLSKVKNSFGFGSAVIASHFITIAFRVISQLLFDIFNFSINTVYSIYQLCSITMLPDSWKTARVAAIFKNGERDDRSKYCYISVLRVFPNC